MTLTTVLAGAAWTTANAPAYAKYCRALGDPAGVQRRLLVDYLRANAATAFGRQHSFASIRSLEEYQTHVPLGSYEDFVPALDEIAQGRPNVLTNERVVSFGLSSGSVSSAKRIPYTRRLQREFRRAIGPWIIDVYRNRPRAAAGCGYWSITPVGSARPDSPGDAVPVGFESDSEYLGGLAKWFADRTLAVPACVRSISDIETFRYVTLLFLLRRPDLTLISVWHPSFLTLLLSALTRYWGSLIDDLDRGTVTPPRSIPPAVREQLRFRRAPERAGALRRLNAEHYSAIWPDLSIVSCWGDGHAALYVESLRRLLPGISIQPKGLLATEGVVTIPFRGLTPLAIRSHFYEFLDGGQTVLAHELEPGRVYSVVVTNGGGLYRYRLEDRVTVNGFVGRTPSLRFLGKDDQVSDICGEKLNETFVAGVLSRACLQAGVSPRLAFLAPRLNASPPRYALFLEADGDAPPAFGQVVDDLLGANPHYRYCRDLGQLAPVEVFRGTSLLPLYLKRCCDNGQRLGDIKPLSLSTHGGWTEVFASVLAPSDFYLLPSHLT